MNAQNFSDPVPSMSPPPKKTGIAGLPTWAVILIGLIVFVCLCLACVFCVLPVLLGDEIGNVFSNIIETLEVTPSPQ